MPEEETEDLCQLPADVWFIAVALNGQIELVLDGIGEKELSISPIVERLLAERPSLFGERLKEFSQDIPQLRCVVAWESRRRTQQVIQTALASLSNPDETSL